MKFLENGTGLLGTKEFDARTTEDFNSIEQNILKHLASCIEPDKTLENFTRVMRSAVFQSIWYSQFKGKTFLKNFLNICGDSQISIDLLASGKPAGDLYLSGECFHLPSKEQIAERNFKELLLNLSVLYTLNKIKEEKFSAIISEAIDSRIKKHSQKNGNNYFIAAMGSYGSREMNYASDIDFLYILEDKADTFKAELSCEMLIKALKNEIEIFDIDLRLRPEGKNSQLARTISSYWNYFHERARIWEFQSLTKLRFVCGNKALFSKFKNMLINRIQELDRTALKKEIIEMHNTYTKQSTILSTDMADLKKSKGGLATIEFAVQYLLLRKPETLKKCMGKTLANSISHLENHSIYPAELNTLLQNYRRIKKLLLWNQNFKGTKNYKITLDGEEGKIFKELAVNNIYIFNKIMEI
jgi:glutamate-ammonia-ligase adenylyltransferase